MDFAKDIKCIKNNILNEFGANNIRDLQVNLNEDYRGDYFAFWSVLENGRWIDHRRYYNSDGTPKT